MIGDTDQYSKMVIDAVFQGVANCMIGGTFKEWLAEDLIALSPYQATPWPQTGVGYFGPGIVGVLDSTIAGSMILTATAGTAAAASPASLTANYAAIAENFDINMLLGMDARKLPFRFRIYPYTSAGIVKYFTVT